MTAEDIESIVLVARDSDGDHIEFWPLAEFTVSWDEVGVDFYVHETADTARNLFVPWAAIAYLNGRHHDRPER